MRLAFAENDLIPSELKESALPKTNMKRGLSDRDLLGSPDSFE
jgi:hypothetical protein